MAESIIKNENSIMTQSLTNAHFYASWRIIKTGNTVVILISGFKNLTAKTYNDLGVVIPEAYRPKRDFIFTLVGSSATYDVYRLNVTEDGHIRVYPYNTVSSQENTQDTVSYIIE